MWRFPGQNPKFSGVWVSRGELSWLLFQVVPGFSSSSAPISGLIPPPGVYSGRLKSSRVPPLSPNLQRNPLGLKLLPMERRWRWGMGRDWGRRLDRSSVLLKRIRAINQWGQPSVARTHLSPMRAPDWADFNLIDTNLSGSCWTSSLLLFLIFIQEVKQAWKGLITAGEDVNMHRRKKKKK